MMRNWTMILLVTGILGNSPAWGENETSAAAPKGTERVPSRPLTSRKALQWSTDYQAALDQAKESGQAVFLFFTGSDWCTYCVKMEKEVLESRDFSSLVGEQFIFVKVDLPRRTKLSPALTEQNQALAKQFRVSTFPTVVIVSAEGKVLFEKSGYTKDLAEKVKGLSK